MKLSNTNTHKINDGKHNLTVNVYINSSLKKSSDLSSEAKK